MRKLIYILFFAVLLSGCTGSAEGVEIHEDVYNDLANDTLQVFDVLEAAANKQEELSESDRKVLDSYIDKYRKQYDNHLLEGINSGIFIATELTIDLLADDTVLESSKSAIQTNKENVIHYIENGKRE